MLPTGVAGVLMVLSLAGICVVAVVAGLLLCLMLRLPWGARAAVTDAALALTVAMITGIAAFEVDTSRGALESRLGLILLAACASVICLHLLRFARR